MNKQVNPPLNPKEGLVEATLQNLKEVLEVDMVVQVQVDLTNPDIGADPVIMVIADQTDRTIIEGPIIAIAEVLIVAVPIVVVPEHTIIVETIIVETIIAEAIIRAVITDIRVIDLMIETEEMVDLAVEMKDLTIVTRVEVQHLMNWNNRMNLKSPMRNQWLNNLLRLRHPLKRILKRPHLQPRPQPNHQVN
jgi:hypothetical protein